MKNVIGLLALALVLGCGGRSREGSIQNTGSDTLVNVAQAWAERYQKVDATASVAVSGGGSGVGIAALLDGTVDIANASRSMKKSEYEAARAKGFEPVEHVVGYDALAVYVHADNPIESLTLAQIAEIYGEGGTTDSWDQLGVTVPGCSNNEIVRISRQNNSGTYAYFKKVAFGPGRDYRDGSRDLHGSKDVVDTVERTPCAIGYSGLAYATPHVRLVPLARAEGDTPVSPSVDTAVDGTYPIARPLLMYTRGEPTGAVLKYLEWIKGPEGQAILREKGYAPISADH